MEERNEAFIHLCRSINSKPYLVQDFGTNSAMSYKDIDSALTMSLVPTLDIIKANPTEPLEGSVLVIDFSHLFEDGIVDQYEAEIIRKDLCIDKNSGCTIGVSTIEEYEETDTADVEDIKFLLNLYCEAEEIDSPFDCEDEKESEPNSLLSPEILKLIMDSFDNDESEEADDESELEEENDNDNDDILPKIFINGKEVDLNDFVKGLTITKLNVNKKK